jgi:hypothetical protein
LRALITDAVEHGASAVERVHLATARRPFAIVEQVPGIEQPARVVHEVHDAIVSTTYSNVRGVNRTVGAALDALLAALDERDAPG